MANAESNVQYSMDTEVQTQDDTPAMTPTEIQEMIATETRHSAHEMIPNEMPSLKDTELDHAFQSATQSAQGGIRVVLYDVVDQVLLDLPREDVLGENLSKLISKYFEVKKASKTFSN